MKYLTGKCLCPYCSGSKYISLCKYKSNNNICFFSRYCIKGLTAINEQNLLECNQLVDNYGNNRQGNFDDIN